MRIRRVGPRKRSRGPAAVDNVKLMKHQSWVFLRSEIEKARRTLGLSKQQFRPVPAAECPKIEEAIYKQFCHINHPIVRPLWLWENFKHETTGVADFSEPIHILDQLIPVEETCWLMLNETVNEKDKFWLYEGQIRPIRQLLLECAGLDEIYLVSKKYEWLLCINHHDVLYGSGKIMLEKLRQLNQLDAAE